MIPFRAMFMLLVPAMEATSVERVPYGVWRFLVLFYKCKSNAHKIKFCV